MASKVSDMVKMYNQTQPRHTGDRPQVARKWPPVDTSGNGNKPPPIQPKPHINGGVTPGRTPHTAPKPFDTGDSNVPAWKRELQRNRVDSAGSRPEPVKYGSDAQNTNKPWQQRNAEQPREENIPLWKQRLNKAQEEEKSKSENTPPWGARPPPEEKKDIPPWRRQMQEKANDSDNMPPPPPPWAAKPAKPEPLAKPSTLPWSERNKSPNSVTKGYTPNGGFPNAPAPPPNKPGLPNRYKGGEDTNQSLAPSRNAGQSRSFMHNIPNKSPAIERTSGSFGNAPQRKTSTSSDSSGVTGSPKNRVSSFLHTKTRTPSMTSQDYPQRAPTPPRGKPNRVNGTPPKLQLPNDVFSMPPPIKTSKPPNVVLPSRGKKKTTPLPPPPISVAPPPPPVSSRPLPLPTSRGLPAPPGAQQHSNLPPSLPGRLPPPSLPGRLPPPSPSKSRDLPPSPGRKSSPLPPPPMEVDDIYDDPGEEPPPPPRMPPPLIKQESSGMIPTWEDEDDDAAEALYDETPDDIGKPPLPAGFPVPGAPAAIPEDAGELYEDPEAEAYMRLKKMEAAENAANNDKKDKKKKDSEKKEKDIKKKFKIKGDIVTEGHGVVKESCRGWGKDLGVSAGENIEIIRMNDNPKGKWLVRNAEGSYGYVDSDKVTINIAELRNTFGVGSKGMGNTSAAPPPIPTEDDEAIYDQTADEDLYEEF